MPVFAEPHCIKKIAVWLIASSMLTYFVVEISWRLLGEKFAPLTGPIVLIVFILIYIVMQVYGDVMFRDHNYIVDKKYIDEHKYDRINIQNCRRN